MFEFICCGKIFVSLKYLDVFFVQITRQGTEEASIEIIPARKITAGYVYSNSLGNPINHDKYKRKESNLDSSSELSGFHLIFN